MLGAGSAGEIRHRPCSEVPRSAANKALLSKRGQHNQSIPPFRPTRAAVVQSPISAYCSISSGRSDLMAPPRLDTAAMFGFECGPVGLTDGLAGRSVLSGATTAGRFSGT